MMSSTYAATNPGQRRLGGGYTVHLLQLLQSRLDGAQRLHGGLFLSFPQCMRAKLRQFKQCCESVQTRRGEVEAPQDDADILNRRLPRGSGEAMLLEHLFEPAVADDDRPPRVWFP